MSSDANTKPTAKGITLFQDPFNVPPIANRKNIVTVDVYIKAPQTGDAMSVLAAYLAGMSSVPRTLGIRSLREFHSVTLPNVQYLVLAGSYRLNQMRDIVWPGTLRTLWIEPDSIEEEDARSGMIVIPGLPATVELYLIYGACRHHRGDRMIRPVRIVEPMKSLTPLVTL
jgi:hypothetical protein